MVPRGPSLIREPNKLTGLFNMTGKSLEKGLRPQGEC